MLGDAAPPRPPERLGRHRALEESLPAMPPLPATESPLPGMAAPVPSGTAPVGGPPAAEPPAVALEQLWPALVRRVAWEGDARRASMRLELGAGALAGVALLLQCDEGRVHVTLSAPGGREADLDAWRARIAARLARAGLVVEGID